MVASPPPAAVKTHDSSASAGAGTSEPEVALSDQRESATVEPGHGNHSSPGHTFVHTQKMWHVRPSLSLCSDGRLLACNLVRRAKSNYMELCLIAASPQGIDSSEFGSHSSRHYACFSAVPTGLHTYARWSMPIRRKYLLRRNYSGMHSEGCSRQYTQTRLELMEVSTSAGERFRHLRAPIKMQCYISFVKFNILWQDAYGLIIQGNQEFVPSQRTRQLVNIGQKYTDCEETMPQKGEHE